MSEQRKPIARLTYRADKITYSILSIWPGKFAGTYDISRDKPSDRRQVIGLFDALKGWAKGVGYLSISIESEREPYAPKNTDTSTQSFVDDDMPF